MAVTRRQKEILDFLESFVSRNGYSPSFEEIARGMGLKSLATVHKHITNLEKKGLLDRVHNRSRSIDVLPVRTGKKGSDRLPLLGRIAAGKPVEAIETAESISLSDIIGNREVFALEVRGDSMRDEHIVSGDYVLVERTRTAREGEIIVALVDGSDATLKRFYREGSMIRLQPSNKDMAPIYAQAANVSIQGKVLGVLRKYA
jgi:repressor LexA